VRHCENVTLGTIVYKEKLHAASPLVAITVCDESTNAIRVSVIPFHSDESYQVPLLLPDSAAPASARNRDARRRTPAFACGRVAPLASLPRRKSGLTCAATDMHFRDSNTSSGSACQAHHNCVDQGGRVCAVGRWHFWPTCPAPCCPSLASPSKTITFFIVTTSFLSVPDTLQVRADLLDNNAHSQNEWGNILPDVIAAALCHND